MHTDKESASFFICVSIIPVSEWFHLQVFCEYRVSLIFPCHSRIQTFHKVIYHQVQVFHRNWCDPSWDWFPPERTAQDPWILEWFFLWIHGYFHKLPSDREKRDHNKIPETLSHHLSQLQYRKDLKTRFRCRPDIGGIVWWSYQTQVIRIDDQICQLSLIHIWRCRRS